MNDAHIKTQAKGNRAKLRDLSRRLPIPPGELLHVITCAGLAAIEHALTSRGGVTFPLTFQTVGKDLTPPPDTLPAHLPAAMVRKLNAMGECIGLENGAATYITEIITNDLEPKDGGGAADILQSLWEISDPAVMKELYRIQSGDGAQIPQFTSEEEELARCTVKWEQFRIEKGLPAEMTYLEYREAYVRGVARSAGMDEDELVKDDILD